MAKADLSVAIVSIPCGKIRNEHMKFFFPIFLALTTSLAAAPPSEAIVDDLPTREYSYELFRHLYRWYMDADEFIYKQGVLIDKEIEIWVRRLDHENDPEDKSIYLEVLIPLTKTEIILKKADYSIPELGMTVKNKDYRIALVDHYTTAPGPEEDYVKITYQGGEVAAALYKTRNQKVFPDEDTRKRLGQALEEHMREHGQVEIIGDQIVFLAPLSPVTNDIWIFWENQRKVIKFTSDADYDSAFYWTHHNIGVEILDLDEDIVISHAEKPGSNAYITKDVAGRILYNCIVLGKKIVIPEDEVRLRHPEATAEPPH